MINMPDEKRNPDMYEQLYLLNIESQNKKIIYDIENFCTCLKKHDTTTEDLLQIINLLRIYEDYFLSYVPIVRRLDEMGKTQLSKRLDEILSDVRETSTIFKQINPNMLDKSKIRIYSQTLI